MLHILAKHALDFLGSELVHYEPAVQDFITNELSQVASLITNYLTEKVEKKVSSAE